MPSQFQLRQVPLFVIQRELILGGRQPNLPPTLDVPVSDFLFDCIF